MQGTKAPQLSLAALSGLAGHVRQRDTSVRTWQDFLDAFSVDPIGPSWPEDDERFLTTWRAQIEGAGFRLEDEIPADTTGRIARMLDQGAKLLADFEARHG